MIWSRKSINIKQNPRIQKLQIHKSINKKKKLHSRNYKSINQKNPNKSKSSNINPKKKQKRERKRAGKKRKRIHRRRLLEPFDDGTEELEEDRWFWVLIFEFGWSCHKKIQKKKKNCFLFVQNGPILHLLGLHFIFLETVSFWGLFGQKIKNMSTRWHDS